MEISTNERRNSALIWVGSLAIFLVAVLISVMHIYLASMDVVFADTWGFMGMIGSALSGHFQWASIWTPHNENRDVILSLVLLASAKYDSLDVKHISYLSIVAVSVTFLSLLWYTYDTYSGRKTLVAWVFIPVSIILFTLNQWENLLLPINFVFFTVVTFTVLSLISMDKSLRSTRLLHHWFWASVVFSWLAMLSSGGGVLVWMVVSLQIILSGMRRRGLKVTFVTYVVIGVISLYLYMHNLGQQTSIWYIVQHPIQFASFFIIGVGNSLVGFFSNQPIISLDFAVGIILLCIYVYCFFVFLRSSKEEREQSYVFIMLIIFGVLEGFLISEGRLSFGLSYAAASRYSTLTQISVVGSILFLFTHRTLHGSTLFGREPMIAILVSISMLFTLLGNYNEWAMTSSRHHYDQGLINVLKSSDFTDSELKPFLWDPKVIRDGKAVLKKFHLNIFS